MPRIFLSYARGDDEAFVKRLHADLTAAGFTVWFDRESLMSRGLTFHHEIKDAIRTEVDRVVYVGGPKAALSAYVREEWQFALECDHLVVTPILRLGDYETCVPGELALLHCEDFRDDALYPAALAKLIENLRQPNPKLGALFAVPSLPAHFLGRPELMRRVRDALLVDLQKPQVITSADAKVGMQGMGGIGKSVLAAALARNREVRQSYPDGIIWISCGQQLTRDDLLARLRDVAKDLGGDTAFDSIPQGQGVLRELLQAKAVLLVLDDVWQSSDAQTFDVIGPRCRMLVTTRDAGILHALHGELVPVSLFTEPEALQLLANAVGCERSTLTPEALEVVRECGCLPLAVALSGGMAKKRGGDFHNVLERLHRADLDKIADRASINERHQNIWRAMQASVEVLSEDEQNRFAELSVFSAARPVPEAAVAILWSHTGHLDDLDAEDLLINLAERSLIRLDEKPDTDGRRRRRVSLHELLRDYTVRKTQEPKTLHQTLIDAYRENCPAGWHTAPNDGYLLENLCYHLATVEDWDGLIGDEGRPGVLTDLRVVEMRCRCGQIFELIADYRMIQKLLPEGQGNIWEIRDSAISGCHWTKQLVEYARIWNDRHDRLANGSVEAEQEPTLPPPPPSSLIANGTAGHENVQPMGDAPPRRNMLDEFAAFAAGQCYPLLEHCQLPGFVLQHAFNTEPAGSVHAVADTLIRGLNCPLLLRAWPVIVQPDPKPPLLKTLSGHTDQVWAVSVTPDGRRAVSGSPDGAVKVWDLESGQCLRTLNTRGTCFLHSVSMTPDGRIAAVAGRFDNALRCWDLESGTCLQALRISGPRGVSIVDMTPDGGRAIVATAGEILYVFDLHRGVCLQQLRGHSAEVMCVSMTPDGRHAVSGDEDGTLRHWDLQTGICIQSLKGHHEVVNSVVVTPDGMRAVSGSQDKTVRLWNLQTGECQLAMKGHIRPVSDVSITPDGRYVVSASLDMTLRLWDVESGSCLRVFRGHGEEIMCVCVTPDGRFAVSGGFDKTVRVWDLRRGSNVADLPGHDDTVTSLSVTPDGRHAVSGSADETIRVWDVPEEICIRTLIGHGAIVTSVCVIGEGQRAISGSFDETLRVWDLGSGERLLKLKGHLMPVTSLSVSSDGRHVVSGSHDETLRLWDLEAAMCLHSMKIPGPWKVLAVSIAPDGRHALSGSDDNIARLWDMENETCVLSLSGHSSWVTSVCVTPDGRNAISGSSDNTLRLWDLETGSCTWTIAGHRDGVTAVAITADGSKVVSASRDKTIRVWDITCGKCLCVYPGQSEFHSVALQGSGRVVCASNGVVIVLELRNTQFGPAIITAENSLQARCAVCGRGLSPPPSVIAEIERQCQGLAGRVHSAGADIGERNAMFLSRCPHCRHVLSFNPFFANMRAHQIPVTIASGHPITTKESILEKEIDYFIALSRHLESREGEASLPAIEEAFDRLKRIWNQNE